MVWFKRLVWALAFISIATVGRAATPCDGIDQSLSSQEEKTWTPIVIKRLNMLLSQMHDTERVPTVDFLKIFRSRGWTILYVEDYVTDEPFLFYKGDPFSGSYVTMDAGAVPLDEEYDIEKGIIKAAPGIPSNLARCYAWYFVEGPRA